ncbi:hypothetical protein [Desulfobacula sp.]|uniref:hypothetical protein n=1 Tax=Desulfobacula sp. TaxID=2593537 RepID=UPI002634C680|nr:hypothetical protein [Desulfobacula sp.]
MSWAGIVDAIEGQAEDLRHLDNLILNFDALIDIYQTLPNQEIQAQVASRMLKAIIYRQPQHPDLEKWSERALLPPSDSLTINITAHILLLQMIHYLLHTSDIKKAEKTLIEARQLLDFPFETPFLRLVAKVMAAYFYMITGKHIRCRQAVTEGLELARESGIKLYNGALSMYFISDLLNVNKIKTAQKYIQEMNSSVGFFNSFDKICYYFQKARMALITGELRKAAINVETTLDLTKKLGMPVSTSDCYILHALVLYASKRHVEAESQLVKARRMIRHYHLTFSKLHLLLTQVHFAGGAPGHACPALLLDRYLGL